MVAAGALGAAYPFYPGVVEQVLTKALYIAVIPYTEDVLTAVQTYRGPLYRILVSLLVTMTPPPIEVELLP